MFTERGKTRDGAGPAAGLAWRTHRHTFHPWRDAQVGDRRGRHDVQVDLIDLTSDYIPLSLFYIKSYAETDPLVGRASRIDVVVPQDATDAARTAGEIVARKPDIVGFSCYIWNMLHTMEIARLVKQQAPGTVIVVGGPDVSSVPKKALDTYPWIDVVVRGEGEETFRALLCHWLERGKPSVEPELRAIQGLGFRDGGEIVLTEQAGRSSRISTSSRRPISTAASTSRPRNARSCSRPIAAARSNAASASIRRTTATCCTASRWSGCGTTCAISSRAGPNRCS